MPVDNQHTLIDSATIIVVRDAKGDRPLEVMMVKRHQNINFAGGAYVFPGGKVDEADLINGPRGEFDKFINTAFREVFEESGLIIATQNGHAIDETERRRIADQFRYMFLEGKIDMPNFLKSSMLAIEKKAIIPFARWITPRQYPKRFDTRFFLAKAPMHQIASPDKGEVVEVKWVKPLDFINEFQAEMMFPTILNLKLLGEAENVEQAFEQAMARKIITVEPRLEDGIRLIDPAAGYGEIDLNEYHPGVKNLP